jgi:hypothetical protein
MDQNGHRLNLDSIGVVKQGGYQFTLSPRWKSILYQHESKDANLEFCLNSSHDQRENQGPFLFSKDSPGIRLEPRWRRSLPMGLLLVATFLWLAVTTWLSLASSSSRPPRFFQKPERTVLVLSLLSNGALFLLGELTSGMCEMLRWTIALRSSGVGIATFLGLSRATSNFGVINLLFSNQNVGH